MREQILITGGAGFIGSHLVDRLVNLSYRVRVIDTLRSQVHPRGASDNMNPDAEYLFGPLEDEQLMARSLRGVDVIIHLAAAVGVGQSLLDVRDFVRANCQGTAALLQTIVSERCEIRKLIVASSMSVYGEGLYRCPVCGPVRPRWRIFSNDTATKFEHLCARHQCVLQPLPIGEDAALQPASVYAVTKRDQEELCLTVGKAYGIDTTAFRFFGVYGPRQTLSNPYAGLMAMFASRLLCGRQPIIFEDGLQVRDFIYIADVVRALLLDLERAGPEPRVYNLGRGEPVPVIQVARILAGYIDPSIEPAPSGWCRSGDVRHCYADISRIREDLGYEPHVTLEQGLKWTAEAAQQVNCAETLEQMCEELRARGLLDTPG